MIHLHELKTEDTQNDQGHFDLRKLEAKIRSLEAEGFEYLSFNVIGAQIVLSLRSPTGTAANALNKVTEIAKDHASQD